MKHIKLISKLNEQAKKKGLATYNRKIEDGYYSYSMVKKEVYRIEKNKNILSLFHYGTLTAKIDLLESKLLYVYGQSVTDSDSVGTFLEVNGLNGYRFGYKSVNGGFYMSYENETKFINGGLRF